MMAKESWLKSEDPELVATAAVICQHPGIHCVEDGYCHYGDCFDGKREKMIQRFLEGESIDQIAATIKAGTPREFDEDVQRVNKVIRTALLTANKTMRKYRDDK